MLECTFFTDGPCWGALGPAAQLVTESGALLQYQDLHCGSDTFQFFEAEPATALQTFKIQSCCSILKKLVMTQGTELIYPLCRAEWHVSWVNFRLYDGESAEATLVLTRQAAVGVIDWFRLLIPLFFSCSMSRITKL